MTERYEEVDKKMLELFRQSRLAVEVQADAAGKALLEEAQAGAQETSLEAEVSSQSIALRGLMIQKLKRAAAVKPHRLNFRARQLALKHPQISERDARKLVIKYHPPENSPTVPQPVPGKWRHFRTAPLFEPESQPGEKDTLHNSWFVELDNSPMPGRPGLQAAAALAIYCAGSSDLASEGFDECIYSISALRFQNGHHELAVTHEGQPVETSELYAVLGFVQAAQSLYE